MDYERMMAAVTAYFGDPTRSQGETREGLETLKEEVGIMLDSLEDKG
jgi:hypothetical protein